LMVKTWGMSDALGPMSYAKGEEQVFLGREIAQHRDYSDETAMKIDSEVSKLINTAYETASKVLVANMDLLHKLADLLLEKETVLGNELDDLILEKEPEFEFPSKLDEDLIPKTKPDNSGSKKGKKAPETPPEARPEGKEPADGQISEDKKEE
jgi:cell division protease FtsH